MALWQGSQFRRDSEWPTERERLGYVCNPRSLKEGTETSRPVATVAVPPLSCRVTGSAPQRKHELMRCTCCLLYSRGDQRQLDAMIACQCPLARLVTLEVDRSLWRDPNFVGHPTWRLRSLLQGTRVAYVTETFRCLHDNRSFRKSSPWQEFSKMLGFSDLVQSCVRTNRQTTFKKLCTLLKITVGVDRANGRTRWAFKSHLNWSGGYHGNGVNSISWQVARVCLSAVFTAFR